jgi:hypothetical protein
MSRNGLTQAAAEARVAAQRTALRGAMHRVHVTINSAGSKTATRRAVGDAWLRFLCELRNSNAFWDEI